MSLSLAFAVMILAVPLPDELDSTAVRMPPGNNQEAVRGRLEKIAAAPAAGPFAEKVCEVARILLAVQKDLPREFAAPPLGNEQQIMLFKHQLTEIQKSTGLIIFKLDTALEELDLLKNERGKQNPTWQIQFDYVRARVAAYIAHVYEHNAMLGMMRKDLPPMNPDQHRGWQLVPGDRYQDREADRYARRARGYFEQLARDHAGTPWEKIAGEEMADIARGLQWRPLPRR